MVQAWTSYAILNAHLKLLSKTEVDSFLPCTDKDKIPLTFVPSRGQTIWISPDTVELPSFFFSDDSQPAWLPQR